MTRKLPLPRFLVPSQENFEQMITQLRRFLFELTDEVNKQVQGVGDDIASAGTIKPDSTIHHVTGTSTISTISVAEGVQGPLWLIGDAAWSTDTNGNIAKAVEAEANEAVLFVFDHDDEKWYPTDHVAAEGSIGTRELGFDPGLISVQTFTSNGTWTRPANVRRVLVKLQAGGGGSGGVGGTGSGEAAESGAGGGGECREAFLDVSGIASSTVTVGSGGSAGSAGGSGGSAGGSGSSGGLSRWADGTNTVTANGGSGGSGSAASSGTSDASAGSGGSGGSGGFVSLPGSDGSAGIVRSGLNDRNARGGASHLGGSTTPSGSSAGVAGKDRGGGAAGVTIGASTGERAGGVGANGIVIVYEYA